MNVVCRFVDDRHDFFGIVSEKLGSEFSLFAAPAGDTAALLRTDVIIFGLPAASDPSFQKKMAALVATIRSVHNVPVVAFIPTPDRKAMQLALAAGAYDCFVESASMVELAIILRRAARFHDLEREVSRLKSAVPSLSNFAEIVGSHPKMSAIFALAAKVAATDATVVIRGESGTGKELLARAIHGASGRSRGPFVAVACAALPETLIEAELFGNEKGAFTGAGTARRGRFEAADHGTIFLDEIGDLPLETQVKLLRVLQERKFERLGSNTPRSFDARVVCATHRDLPALVKEGKFRSDLFYRINTVEITLPPLRERRDDIVILAYTFLEKYAKEYGRPALRISPAALTALEEYDYPGNVRELQNIIARAAVICDGPEVRLEHLPSNVAGTPVNDHSFSFEEEVRDFKRRLIHRTLLGNGNNKLQAARSLKIARSYLHRLIEELQVVATEQTESSALHIVPTTEEEDEQSSSAAA